MFSISKEQNLPNLDASSLPKCTVNGSLFFLPSCSPRACSGCKVGSTLEPRPAPCLAAMKLIPRSGGAAKYSNGSNVPSPGSHGPRDC